MTDRFLTRLAWSLCGVALLLISLTLVLIVLGWSTPLPKGWTPWRDQAISLAGIVGAPILGGLISSRHPRNPYGWLWLGFGLGLIVQSLAESYGAYALVVEPGSLPAPQTISHLLAFGGPLSLSIAPFLLMLFPTGRLPSRRWRYLAWPAATSGAVVVLLNLLFDSPDQSGGMISIVTIVVVSVIFMAIVLSAFSLVVRYRRASGLGRQQLKWVALAAALVGISSVGQLLWLELLLGEAFFNLLGTATITCLYAAIGIAILRHRLYDIDVIINRALVYGSLTVMLVGIYLGAVISLQYALRAVTGQESQIAIVASTLAIAALFNPLRRRIQEVVDRRFYRNKYDAAKTLEEFGARLREEVDLDDLELDLVSVVRETVQPDHASLWLKPTKEGTGR